MRGHDRYWAMLGQRDTESGSRLGSGEDEYLSDHVALNKITGDVDWFHLSMILWIRSVSGVDSPLSSLFADWVRTLSLLSSSLEIPFLPYDDGVTRTYPLFVALIQHWSWQMGFDGCWRGIWAKGGLLLRHVFTLCFATISTKLRPTSGCRPAPSRSTRSHTAASTNKERQSDTPTVVSSQHKMPRAGPMDPSRRLLSGLAHLPLTEIRSGVSGVAPL